MQTGLKPTGGVEAEEEEGEEEEPTVAEFVDERPDEVKLLEQFRQSKNWKVIGGDDVQRAGGQIAIIIGFSNCFFYCFGCCIVSESVMVITGMHSCTTVLFLFATSSIPCPIYSFLIANGCHFQMDVLSITL